MSDEAAGSLRDAWAALTRLGGRLDDLAGAVARLEPEGEPATPPGEPLGEAARAHLRRLGALLAVGPHLDPGDALLLAVDRLIHGAGADCAAVLVRTADGRLEATGHQGFVGGPPTAATEGGIVGRALAEQETIVGGAADHDRDPLLRAHRLARALAVPIRVPARPPLGVLLAGWRRPVEIGGEALEILTVVADRLAVVLGAGGRPTAVATAAALLVDLDLGRTADAIARHAVGLLGAEVVRVLVSGTDGLRPAAGGSPGEAPAPFEAGAGPPAAVLASGHPWTADGDDAAPVLSAWLGAPARLVVPLGPGDRPVGLLVAGGPRALDAARLVGFLPAAGTALRNARIHTDTLAALVELSAADRPTANAPPPARDFASLLAVILGRLSGIRERAADASLVAELDVAEEAAWRAAEAVRGLLGFAPGHRADTLEPLDLLALLRTAAAEAPLRGTGRSAGSPVVQLDLEPLPPVRGSVPDLREAVDHLLDNALEASPAGSPVVLRARWDGGPRVEVSVEDRGAGMDEVLRARASEPFFSTRGPGRLGLGLPVVQAIVARHRGELEVTSAPGLGTTVRLRLPTVAGGRRGARRGRSGAARVLVVEHEAAVRDTLVEVIGQLGHVPLTASTSAEALATIGSQAVDVVITDLALPGGSGLEVARSARRVRGSLPVILVTAWPGHLDPTQVEESGVAAVIEKPVGLAEVRAALASVLARPGARRP